MYFYLFLSVYFKIVVLLMYSPLFARLSHSNPFGESHTNEQKSLQVDVNAIYRKCRAEGEKCTYARDIQNFSSVVGWGVVLLRAVHRCRRDVTNDRHAFQLSQFWR